MSEFAAALGLPDDFVIFSGGRQRKVVTAGLLLYKKHAKAGGGSEGAAGSAGGGGGGDSVGGCGEGGDEGGDISGHVDKNSVKRVCGALTQALALGEDAETLSQELAFVYKYYRVRVCVYT